jgi:predicted RNA-binding protein Jag
MNQKTLEAKAETMEKAMESIIGRIPPGWFILSTIETPPLESKQRESADTVEEALEQARKKISMNVQNLKEMVIREPLKKKETVFAFDENEAKQSLSTLNDEAVRILNVEMAGKGSKGLLGFGKKPHSYEVELLYQAIVEVSYWSMAEISAEISNDSGMASARFLEFCEKGDYQMVKDFLEKGADINTCNLNGSTALMLSAFNGHDMISDFLIDSGIEVNRRDNGGFNALMVACECPTASINLVKKLIEKGADVNARSGRGSTALMAAAKIGHPDIVALLVSKGADINARNTDHNVTPLIWAANGGHQTIVQFLLKKGADRNIVTNNNYTAASIARENGHYHVADIIDGYHQ